MSSTDRLGGDRLPRWRARLRKYCQMPHCIGFTEALFVQCDASHARPATVPLFVGREHELQPESRRPLYSRKRLDALHFRGSLLKTSGTPKEPVIFFWDCIGLPVLFLRREGFGS